MKKLLIALFAVLVCVSAHAKVYNIVDFGAKSDTTILSTVAINKAIKKCNAEDGGTVLIPAGMFKSGTITLLDHVELHLAHGATLYGSTDQKDFPRQKQPEYRSQKDPGGWYSFIYAEGATNIAITGSGTIDGQGKYQKARPECIKGDRDGRARNILFISCKKVKVEDVTLRNAGVWNQHYLNCEDVTLNNQTVWNHCNRNNDALDIPIIVLDVDTFDKSRSSRLRLDGKR